MDAENQAGRSGISLRKSIAIYSGFLAVTLVLMSLSLKNWLPGLIVLIVYLGFGAYMNRVVLRGLIEWHPMYNTLENVAGAKLKSFLFWPLTYPFLFMRLAVNRVL